MMDHLQFIQILSDEGIQNTPEEIQIAFDGFMRYCEKYWEDPSGFQNMLYFHEILSSYSLRDNNRLALKKKSTSHCSNARGDSICVCSDTI